MAKNFPGKFGEEWEQGATGHALRLTHLCLNWPWPHFPPDKTKQKFSTLQHVFMYLYFRSTECCAEHVLATSFLSGATTMVTADIV